MPLLQFLFLFTCVVEMHRALQIKMVLDVILQPLNIYDLITTIHYNVTCEQCLCDLYNLGHISSYLAVNCFPNNTCQFFANYSQTYKLPGLSGARLYFLQSLLPNPSTCCMPNITQVIDRLENVTPLVLNLSFEPSAMSYDDNNPDEMAFIGRHGGWVYWIDPTTLTPIRNTSMVNASLSLTVRNDRIYTAMDGVVGLNVHHRLNGTFIASINHPGEPFRIDGTATGTARKC